jgi:hypothetical protein
LDFGFIQSGDARRTPKNRSRMTAMQFLDPDILGDVCGLSPALLITGLVMGAVLWLFGWRTHRFWVVLLMTVLAGIYGLYEAPMFRDHPLLASLLLALTAGVLALSLVRLLAFAAGGLAGLLAIQALSPAWSQHFLVFLAAGLVGLFLFRLWMMALTSITGTILMACASLALLNRSGKIDAVAWTEQGTVMINWLVGLGSLLGLIVQYVLERRRQNKNPRKSAKPGEIMLLPLWGWSLKAHRKAG